MRGKKEKNLLSIFFFFSSIYRCFKNGNKLISVGIIYRHKFLFFILQLCRMLFIIRSPDCTYLSTIFFNSCIVIILTFSFMSNNN